MVLAAEFLDALLAGNGLAGSLAGAGVGASALTAHGQAAAMAQPAITADVTQAGNVLLHLAAERTFHRLFTVENAGQAADVVFRQVFGPPLRIDFRFAAQLQRRGRTDSVDVAKRNMGRFVVRKVHAENTRHLVSLAASKRGQTPP